MKAWHAEHIVDTPKAQQLIQEQFPNFKLDTIDYLSAGWDNTAYLVNNNFIFRFPRRSIAIDLLQHEATILPFLAGKLPLTAPVPEYIGKASETYPCPFIGYRLLVGTPACEAYLSNQQRRDNAAILGDFLCKLHAIILPKQFHFKPIFEDRISSSILIPRIQKALSEIEKHGTADVGDLKTFITQLDTTSYIDDGSRCLVHGDFYPKHILVNDAKIISGVIDWGDVEINNPAIDLAIAFQFLPKEAHDIFRQHYQHPISESTWKLALLRALYSASTLVVYALDVNDLLLLQDSLLSLKYIAEVVA